ncbi:MAG: nucleotidyltransferase family protein [Nitrospinae bacterium]|nr:nucleotidyltransferase family protein [Nitrospinota bacterium]
MTIKELLLEKRDLVLHAASRHGAGNVRVFGSVARGNDDENSDIDLLVELAPGTSLLDHAALCVELEIILGKKVDVVSDRAIKSRIRERIMREAKPL